MNLLGYVEKEIYGVESGSLGTVNKKTALSWAE
jgi:hypothetical protein